MAILRFWKTVIFSGVISCTMANEHPKDEAIVMDAVSIPPQQQSQGPIDVLSIVNGTPALAFLKDREFILGLYDKCEQKGYVFDSHPLYRFEEAQESGWNLACLSLINQTINRSPENTCLSIFLACLISENCEVEALSLIQAFPHWVDRLLCQASHKHWISDDDFFYNDDSYFGNVNFFRSKYQDSLYTLSTRKNGVNFYHLGVFALCFKQASVFRYIFQHSQRLASGAELCFHSKDDNLKCAANKVPLILKDYEEGKTVPSYEKAGTLYEIMGTLIPEELVSYPDLYLWTPHAQAVQRSYLSYYAGALNNVKFGSPVLSHLVCFFLDNQQDFMSRKFKFKEWIGSDHFVWRYARFNDSYFDQDQIFHCNKNFKEEMLTFFSALSACVGFLQTGRCDDDYLKIMSIDLCKEIFSQLDMTESDLRTLKNRFLAYLGELERQLEDKRASLMKNIETKYMLHVQKHTGENCISFDAFVHSKEREFKQKTQSIEMHRADIQEVLDYLDGQLKDRETLIQQQFTVPLQIYKKKFLNLNRVPYDSKEDTFRSREEFLFVFDLFRQDKYEHLFQLSPIHNPISIWLSIPHAVRLGSYAPHEFLDKITPFLVEK